MKTGVQPQVGLAAAGTADGGVQMRVGPRGSAWSEKMKGFTTKVKQAPSARRSPEVKQQLAQAVFQSFHRSRFEKVRQTTAMGAWMRTSALMTSSTPCGGLPLL
jgi:hypothetical protein